MFLRRAELAAISLAPVPVRGSRRLPLRPPRRARRIQEVQQRIAELTAEVEENVSGVRVVKAFAREERQLDASATVSARVFDQSMFSTRMQAFYSPFIGFLPHLGLARDPARRRPPGDRRPITVGDFTAFYGYLLMLIGPMRTLGMRSGMAQRATASGARIFQILDRAPRDRRPPRRARRCRPAADASSCAARAFATRAPRRRRCATSTWTSPAGTTVALVGATGSGKTSLVSLLPRLYDVDRGRGPVDGADVRDLDPVALRREIAIVNDDPFLFSRHASHDEHRLRARRTPPREEVEQAARRAQADGFIARAARRLRHAHRRARPDALRRPAPAPRDRPRAARRPAHPRPRRRHLERRRLDRAADQAGAARGDGGPHDVRDRPPPLDDRARRRDRRARARPRSSRTARTTSCSSSPSSTARSSRRACPTRSSSTRKPLEPQVAGL